MQEFERQLTTKEQLRLRDEFFRRLGRIPVKADDIYLYSAVVGEELRKVLPDDIKTALKELLAAKLEDKRPVFIKGFKVGYTGLNTKDGIIAGSTRHDLYKELGLFSRRRELQAKTNQAKNPATGELYEATEKPYSALMLAMAGLLGIQPTVHKSLTRNYSTGGVDEAHRHIGQYAAVLGAHGQPNVNTKIWYKLVPNDVNSNKFIRDLEENVPPDYQKVLGPGDGLIIPTNFVHAVDGFTPGTYKWGVNPKDNSVGHVPVSTPGGGSKEKRLYRITIADFLWDERKAEKYTEEQMAEGKTRFLIDRNAGRDK